MTDNEEMDALRRQEDTLHIDDVDDSVRERVYNEVASRFEERMHMRGIDVEVKNVWVKGSFERGEAVPKVSDLDLRLSVFANGHMDYGVGSAVCKKITKEDSPEITENTPFGFVDPEPVLWGSNADEGEVMLA